MGSSLCAIDFIAQMHGYTVIHVMREFLDVFLVSNEVLDQTACHRERLPLVSDMAKRSEVGRRRYLPPCTPEEAARFVDIRFELAGCHKAARQKAIADIQYLNQKICLQPRCEGCKDERGGHCRPVCFLNRTQQEAAVQYHSSLKYACSPPLEDASSLKNLYDIFIGNH